MPIARKWKYAILVGLGTFLIVSAALVCLLLWPEKPSATTKAQPNRGIPDRQQLEKIHKVLASIKSFRSSDTEDDLLNEPASRQNTAETEYIEPGKKYERTKKRDETGEGIFIGSDAYFRKGNGPWMKSQAYKTGSFVESWVKTIDGKPNLSSAVIIDRGSRYEKIGETQCLSFWQTELFQGEGQGEGYVVVWTFSISLDAESYLPVRSGGLYRNIVKNKINAKTRWEYLYRDFNKEIKINAPPLD